MEYKDLSKRYQEYVAEVAKQYNVNVEGLWQAYCDTMASNFEQDIIDIAKEI